MAPTVSFQRILNVLATLKKAGVIAYPKGTQSRDVLAWDQTLDHPGYGLTPQMLVNVQREAEAGYPRRQCNLIDDLLKRDSHARSLFDRREQAVAGKPVTIHAGGASDIEKQVARVMRFALVQPGVGLRAAVKHLMRYNRYGWAAVEIDWGLLTFEGRLWVVPVKLTPVASRRFRIVTPAIRQMLAGRGIAAEVDELRLYRDPSSPWGDALIPGKWIVMKVEDIDVARGGLGVNMAWNCLGKGLSYRDWLVLSEKYGMPLPLAKYKTQDGHADDKAIDTAEEIVKNIGNDGGAVIPDTITLEIIKAFDGLDGSKMQGSLIAYCNSENSKLVNGSTLSNDNSGGGGASYALGAVHDGVRWEAVTYDAANLEGAIGEQMFAPFLGFNGIVANDNEAVAPPKFVVQVVQDLTPSTQIQIAEIMVNKLGIKISVDQLRGITGYREPTDDDDVVPGMPDPQPIEEVEDAA